MLCCHHGRKNGSIAFARGTMATGAIFVKQFLAPCHTRPRTFAKVSRQRQRLQVGGDVGEGLQAQLFLGHHGLHGRVVAQAAADVENLLDDDRGMLPRQARRRAGRAAGGVLAVAARAGKLGKPGPTTRRVRLERQDAGQQGLCLRRWGLRPGRHHCNSQQGGQKKEQAGLFDKTHGRLG